MLNTGELKRVYLGHLSAAALLARRYPLALQITESGRFIGEQTRFSAVERKDQPQQGQRPGTFVDFTND